MIRAIVFTPTGPGVLHLDALHPRVYVPVFERAQVGLRDYGHFQLRTRQYRLRWWRCDAAHMNLDWVRWPGVGRTDPPDGPPYYLIPVYKEDV